MRARDRKITGGRKDRQSEEQNRVEGECKRGRRGRESSSVIGNEREAWQEHKGKEKRESDRREKGREGRKKDGQEKRK